MPNQTLEEIDATVEEGEKLKQFGKEVGKERRKAKQADLNKEKTAK